MKSWNQLILILRNEFVCRVIERFWSLQLLNAVSYQGNHLAWYTSRLGPRIHDSITLMIWLSRHQHILQPNHVRLCNLLNKGTVEWKAHHLDDIWLVHLSKPCSGRDRFLHSPTFLSTPPLSIPHLPLLHTRLFTYRVSHLHPHSHSPLSNG